MTISQTKNITWQDIANLRTDKTLVTTNGSFDILHIGHVRILQQAKAHGDILVVLLNSDISVQANKGPLRPIIPEKERLEMLCALACVDYVILFEEKEVTTMLEKIRPDIHIKGGTYLPERIQTEKDLVEKFGGKHICLETIGNFSTTSIIDKILQTEKASQCQTK